MGNWVKQLAIGMLQSYIYGQKDDLIAWFAYMAKKSGHPEWTIGDGISVPAEDVIEFWKVMLKALCAVMQHGSAPAA